MIHSLKFRIAIVIIVLQSIVTAIVLDVSLKKFFSETQDQLAATEGMLSHLVSEFSRTALITYDFGELQPLVEKIVVDPHVEKIILTNAEGLIVVGSDVTDIGSVYSIGEKAEGTFWQHHEIKNPSGKLGELHVKFSHADIIQTNHGAIALGIKIALVCIGFIAVFGIFFGFLLTRRLGKVAVTARQIGLGNLDARTNLVGKDEVAVVSRAIDYMGDSISKMVQELNQQKLELRDARDNLEKRVLERTNELAVARDEALNASKAKSAFLANMSHELRTPLNAILGYSELLIDESREKENANNLEYAKSINIAGRNLLNLINDVLDIERIEAGKQEFQVQRFSLHAMLDNINSTFKPMAIKNNNQYHAQVNTGIADLIIDEVKLRQILLNLLSNAAKFTKNGIITLTISSFEKNGEEWLDFTTTDTGVGIAENHLTKLFEKFYQVDSSYTREYQGVGLGLAICYQLAHAMGGALEVTSELHKGSAFKLLIARDVSQKLSQVA
ncbi:MAG TPA: ATP-binding protein [Gammaproteobacteria bacterium]